MSNPSDSPNPNALAISEGTQIEIIPPTALEAMTRAEVDTQIATAHRYPRKMSVFKTRAIEMATIDESTAESTIYCRPVGKDQNGKQKFAEGLSVRMAEIVGACYGNLRVGAMIVEQTERYVIVRGYAHDLESNFMSTSEVKEPTVTSKGFPYSENMRAVIAKAALAKARRDATFQVVPKALCRPIELAARALIAGDGKSLETRRAAAVAWVQRLNINEDRVWKAIGVGGPADLTGQHLMDLTGLRNAIKDNETTIDDAFPEIIATGRVGGASTGSVTEAAKAEAEKEKKPDQPGEGKPEPEQKGPQEVTKESLLATIVANGGKIDAGKAKIEKAAKALRYMEPADKLEKADSKTLANIIDSWPDIQDEIMNPGAPK